MAPTSTLQSSKNDNIPVHNHQALPTSLVKHPLGATAAKKISRRSSKPIINWLQRKIGGSVRARRIEASSTQPGTLPKGSGSSDRPLPRASTRVVSAPSPSVHGSSRNQDSQSTARKNTISLLDDDDERRTSPFSRHDDASSYHYSDNASSRSGLEADEDASMRPLPPSSPPSPSPSRSSSSYMSDPRTFRSLAASTKPTTLISLDIHGGGGMAHIAQSTSPTTHLSRLHNHGRSTSTHTNPGVVGSGASITFSQLPATSPEASSRPSSLLSPTAALGSVQAPLHTTHHPRNNPRPSSPPMDNASILTLASSAFGASGTGHRIEPSLRSAPLSVIGMSDSTSHIGTGSMLDGESTSQYVMGFDERQDDRDVDASVRALRPRSSRRGSWESEMSRWSARGPLGTPSFARDLSVWTKTEELPVESDVHRDRDSIASASALNHFTATQTDIDPATPNMPSSSNLKLDPTDITPGKEHSPDDMENVLSSKFASLGRESQLQEPTREDALPLAKVAMGPELISLTPPAQPRSIDDAKASDSGAEQTLSVDSGKMDDADSRAS